MNLEPAQLAILDAVRAAKNVVVLGPAGTGKSTLIPEIIRACPKKCVVTGSTGISAYEAGGQTFHRTTALGEGCEKCTEKKSCSLEYHIMMYTKRRNKRLYNNVLAQEFWDTKQDQVLLIEEISCLPGSMFHAFDHMCRRSWGDPRPFGGMQVILIGDFLQLPPINDEFYVFETPSWRDTNSEIFSLEKIYRQDDPQFVQVLTEARYGKLSDASKKILLSRVKAKLDIPEGFKATRLRPFRKQVDEINKLELAVLTTPLQRFIAKIRVRDNNGPATRKEHEEFVRSSLSACRFPEYLELKVGALVLVTANIPELRVFNGTRAIVDSINFKSAENVSIGLKLTDGRTISICTVVSEFRQKNLVCTIIQFPLILAWALTIHKSQGLTIDYLDVTIPKRMFAASQAYVALSRVRTLQGLTISQLDFNGIFCDQRVLDFYANLKAKERRLREEQEQSKKRQTEEDDHSSKRTKLDEGEEGERTEVLEEGPNLLQNEVIVLDE